MRTKKNDLIETAAKLFCANGFNATGIDKVLKEANVSKMTMYKYFLTKDELIIAVLEDAHEKFMKNVIAKIDALKILPQKKIVKLFDILSDFAQKKNVVRCVFINASAEFPDIKNPIHQKAIEHKISTEIYVKRLLKEMKVKNPNHFARAFTTLSQGSLIMAQITDDRNYYADSKKVFLNLIN